ncbi:uncharacterized protein DNG_01838 [Cephalotrichum gorgonifer]|uniref:C2H2-type domain-containing protein n=1 Tax=Cephalotrichum gorgonifer TaxID=2041049 RepID=A0AAE8MTX7_9PEZI|nr:uncharacterized protein DNG_01838 [Cephalotrichum gorgonifer]
MVSIEPPFDMFDRQIKIERDQYSYSRYPSAPQSLFNAPMDNPMGSYAPFAGEPAHTQEAFTPAPAMPTFEYDPASLYPDHNPGFAYNNNGRSSPGDDRAGSSNISTASAPSAASSAVGSPQSNHGQLAPIPAWAAAQGMNVSPDIVGHPDYFSATGNGAGNEYGGAFPPQVNMEEYPPYDFGGGKPGFVDPSLIHPEINSPMNIPFDATSFRPSGVYPTSPAHSHGTSSPQPMMRNGSQSPFLHNGFQQPFSPYQTPLDASAAGARRASHVYASPGYHPDASAVPATATSGSAFSGDEAREKSRCPHPDCGRSFKDLKAHMLTHQNERPEKCPIGTCEYHIKGFSRKYDRNRHTLTHYKGTMVCGFCPGSGSAAEKSFNRADVFKRHLTAVHGVEQTPPNSRKKALPASVGGKRLTGAGYPSDATGKCSTCSQTFANAQDFYEHLDDCVLRIVQQEDPSEAVNARRLAEVENDTNVIRTLEKNHLPTTLEDGVAPDGDAAAEEEDDEEMGDEDSPEGDDDDRAVVLRVAGSKRKTGPVGGVQKSRGMTHSRGGVTLHTRRGRKHRRDYPASWGFDKGQMTMKKRVMTVFDGPRRLAKDDMMLSTEHEVRVAIGDGSSYVTDLDVQTMKRAEGFHGATDAEKGPWISDDPTEDELRVMREMLEVGETEAA